MEKTQEPKRQHLASNDTGVGDAPSRSRGLTGRLLGFVSHHPLVIYTLLFAVFCYFTYQPFLKADKSMVRLTDGLRQHYVAFAYIGRYARTVARNLLAGKGLVLPMWSFSLGLGGDVITTIHYYGLGDPLNLVSIVTPTRYSEYVFEGLVFLRMYLAGLALYAYCRCMRRGSCASLAGALVYASSGWAVISSTAHPFFLNPMIYFPLLLVGFERIARKESPVLFALMVFVSAISSFYFFYMLLIAIVLYALLRFFAQPHEHFIGEFFGLVGRCLLYGIIGVMMSAPILAPVILEFLGNPRAESATVVNTFYARQYYRVFFKTLISMEATGQFWSVTSFTPIAFLAVSSLFGRRGSWSVKLAFICVLTGAMLPIVGSVANGMSYPTNRWIWLFAVVIGYIVALEWDRLTTLDGAEFAVVCVACVLYATYCVTLHVKGLGGNVGAIMSLLILAAALVVVTWSRGSQSRGVIDGAQLLLVVVLVLGSSLNGWMAHGYHLDSTMSAFADWGQVAKMSVGKSVRVASDLQKDGEGFNRVDRNYSLVKDEVSFNSAILKDVELTSVYWSLTNGSFANMLLKSGFAEEWLFQRYAGLNERTALQALSSVRYYATKKGWAPFGYELKEKVKGISVYENEHALPLGYCFESYLSESDFDALSLAERQAAMLQGVVVGEDAAAQLSKNIGVTEPRFSFAETSLAGRDTAAEDATIEWHDDGSCTIVAEEGARIAFKVDVPASCEMYLQLDGMSVDGDDEDGDFRMVASDGRKSRKFSFYTGVAKWQTGQDAYLVNFGFEGDARNELTLEFWNNGTYTFEGMSIIAQPMDDYVANVTALAKVTMENEQISANRVSGTVNAPKPMVLCLSIPYSKGWTATVDGKKVDTFAANIGFTGIALDAGEHEVVLRYRTRGLLPGIAACVVGTALLVVLTRHRRRMAMAA